ncbi:MAG: methyltransferase domain-containing protein [Thiohalocapsa sp.]
MNSIDYYSIASIYDIYSHTNYDYEFFTREVRQGLKVLELTSGTGRLSIPLLAAGADLTCVDISQGMLNELERKLKEHSYSAELICADMKHLDLKDKYELAILPFQSFMELIGREKQLNVLSSVYRTLASGGRFFCTMHNPVIRRQVVDGCLRFVGKFPINGEGTMIVSGFEQGGSPVVSRTQFFEYYDRTGALQKKRILEMEFELIEFDQFREMVEQAGFSVKAVYGDYDHSEFAASESATMIWELERS